MSTTISVLTLLNCVYVHDCKFTATVKSYMNHVNHRVVYDDIINDENPPSSRVAKVLAMI